MGMYPLSEVGVPVLVPVPVEGFGRQDRVFDSRHVGILLEIVVHPSQYRGQSVRHRPYRFCPPVGLPDGLAGQGSYQDGLGDAVSLVVSEVLEQPDYSLQIDPGNPALVAEPVTVPRPIRQLEFIRSPVAYVMSGFLRNARDRVEMKLAGIVDGDTAGTQFDTHRPSVANPTATMFAVPIPSRTTPTLQAQSAAESQCWLLALSFVAGVVIFLLLECP